MINLLNYKPTNVGDSFIRVNDLSQYGIELIDVVPKTEIYKTCNQLIGATIEDVYNAIKQLEIPVYSLFDYATYGFQLIKEKGVYTQVKEDGIIRNVYHDVYLCNNRYQMCEFKFVMEHLLMRKYPHIFQNEVFHKEMDTNVFKLPTKQTKLKDIDFGLSDLTIEELLKLMNKQPLFETCFHFYDAFIALDLETNIYHERQYTYSLIIPYSAIQNKDWSIVENYDVHSIIKRNPNDKLGLDADNWFRGKQKDAPFWDNPLIEIVKDLIKS